MTKGSREKGEVGRLKKGGFGEYGKRKERR